MKTFLVLLFLVPTIQGEILYDTDFDNFPIGANNWSGNDGWISNDTTSGAQAIDENVLPSLLKTATLGFAQPTSRFTFIALDLEYDHIASGKPVVEIDTLIGIEDSTNNRRDDFYFSIYNADGDRLASIRFDNENPDTPNSQFGIWRVNDTNQFDTLFDFTLGELFNLVATVNLEENVWSASIDEIPIFENAQFSNTDAPLDFGFLAFEWELASLAPYNYGDNFLLVADLSIQSIDKDSQSTGGMNRIEVTHQFDPIGGINLNWQTAIGWTDQVEYSDDLVTWFADLPGSTFENLASPTGITFSQPKDPDEAYRFYRVRRTKTP
ncbi:hypothetical protein N8587_03525 [Akkermansiaceae bacterium]|nr:hypothetical protein [Akkermansiaceae bacterium]MDB4617801.1 hypothetical protein [bacterium]MDA7670361.1 hypothetical protein [Akkermansiaceae bacterium]MDA7871367.1 hypothetical protein [Akkermansiaceae bacterium]MDA7872890.1 hypothetical protein [Akkermansiaceae bacterium]